MTLTALLTSVMLLSPLQHDADAIRALGVTGVQARAGHAVTSGVADIGTGRPVPSNGHFRIGSTNKTLVATVVLQLEAEGALRLDDTAGRLIPDVTAGSGHGRATVRQLLQHTAGIPDDAFPSIGSAADYRRHRYDHRDPAAIVAAAMRLEPGTPPGTWDYSNTGYLVLGMIIERVTGRPWHHEAERRILRPLHMTHTIWPGDSPSLPRPHARGYQRFAPGEPLTDVTELIDADASGGYVSTTADLTRFLRGLTDGSLLPKAQLAKMRQTVPVDEQTAGLWPGARYGLGIFSRPLPCGGTAWMPSGDQIGYKTRTGVTADGRRTAVVSMSTQLNDSLASAQKQEDAAFTLIARALC